MERERELPLGALAWSVLGAAILAYEYFAPKNQLLSEAVDRGLEHPVGKYAIPAFVGATALHLINVMPPEIDVWHHLGRLKREP